MQLQVANGSQVGNIQKSVKKKQKKCPCIQSLRKSGTFPIRECLNSMLLVIPETSKSDQVVFASVLKSQEMELGAWVGYADSQMYIQGVE
jgi:hypothetical protein